MSVSLSPKPKATMTWPHGEPQQIRDLADAKGGKK